MITRAVAALAALGAAVLILLLSARPLATADNWYYLKMGELYAAEGPLAQSEPMLFTHGDVKPTPHEWLSEVLYYLVQDQLGFQGLRAFHAVLVVAILALAWRLFRRAAGGAGLASLGFVLWAVLTYPRLYQTRADLFSILAALLIYGWVLEDPQRTRRAQLAMALAVAVFWVNAHSLFLIAFAVAGAGALGALLERLETRPPGTPEDPRPREVFRALATFIGLGVLVTALNPRGLAQHVTFFTSQSEHAIWDVVDDWYPFNPLDPSDNSPMLSGLGWLCGGLVLLLFGAAAVAAARAARPAGNSPPSTTGASVATPPSEAGRLLDLPAVLMGIAGAAAYLISFRFMWLSFLPLLYATRVAGRLAPTLHAPAAGGALSLVAALPTYGFWLLLMSDVPGWPAGGRPADPGLYLRTAVNHTSFAGEGATFLSEAGVEGRMFNNYTLGAYLGYHLAPRIRTFIDGRTEHYSAAVAKDYDVIESGGVRPTDGRPYLELLEDYGVDIFFGVGGPGWPYVATATLRHLEGVPWWRLVYRSAGFAIYLRDHPRNDANFNRVAMYWARHGVAFDRAAGLDVGAVLARAPEWAAANRLVPAGALEGPQAAFHRFVAGDYEGAILETRRQLDAGAGADTALRAAEAQIALGRFTDAERVLEVASARGANPGEVARVRELLVATREFRNHLEPR